MSAIEPYVGPRAFTLEDRARFFGRKEEMDETVSLIIAHPVVLIYALSGVGKSSLVNAGVVPLLREEGYAVLPPARVEGVMPESVRAAEVGNVFVFNALAWWLDVQEVPFCAAEEVVGFRVTDFVAAWLQARPAESADAAPVLIFDQFEEIFTGNEARWKERDDFFAQMGEALRDHPSLKLVFVMREEFVARLEPFARFFPRQLRTRKRLERLRAPAALAAIVRPVEKLGVRFQPAVAEQLVSDLLGVQDEGGGEVAGEFVEPVQLQVVCRNLWEKLPQEIRDGTIGGSLRVITPEHLAAAGETTTALSNYYTAAIAAAAQRAGTGEGRLRRWFGETLIAGDHSSLGLAVKGQGETAKIPDAALTVLGSRYLIRHERRGAAEWYELSHARFIEPILASNAHWLEQRSGADAIRKKLLARAAELEPAGGVLEEWELRGAEAYLATPDAEELGGRERLLPLVQRSHEALNQRQKRRRQLRVMLVILALTGLGAWIAFALALSNSRTARAQELAFRAVDEIPRDPERALLLALESGALRRTDPGLKALRRALIASPLRQRLHDEQSDGKSIMATAWSPDGTTIVTGGADANVRLWDAAHGRFLGLLGEPNQRHVSWVWSVAFSPDGHTLATASRDGTVRLWSLPRPAAGWADPRILEHRRGDELVTVRMIAFDATGRQLLACCHDGSVSIWDVATGQETRRFQAHEGFVRGGAFHPTQPLAITVGEDGNIRLWDLAAPAPPLPAAGPGGKPPLSTPLATLRPERTSDPPLWDVRFDASGSRFVTAGMDHTVRVWDFATRTELLTLDGHAGAVVQARFIDDARLVSVSVDKTVRVWSLRPLRATALQTSRDAPAVPVQLDRLTADSVSVIRGHADYIRSVSISPDLESLVTSSRDGAALIWRMPPACETGLLRCGAVVSDLAYSPDSQRLVTAASKTPTVWSVAGDSMEKPLLRLAGHSDPVNHVVWQPDGARIVTADVKYVARVWDAQTGRELRTLPQKLASLAFDPTGRFLVGSDGGKRALLVDLESGETRATFTGHEARVMTAEFSRDGKRIVTASNDQTAKIWDAETAQPLLSLPLKTAEYPGGVDNDIVLCATFTPDGRAVAMGCADGNITLWDIEAKKLIAQLRGHEGQVRQLRFFRRPTKRPRDHDETVNGRVVLISTGFDSTTRLWEPDAKTGGWREVDRFSPETDPDRSLLGYAAACSPDGVQIAAGGEDGVVRLHYRDAAWLWPLAAQRVTRQLTDEERGKFRIGK